MTYDNPQPPPRVEPVPPINVDMSNPQNGRQTFGQRGTLEQQGRLTQSGRVDASGSVQQRVDGNTLRTGDLQSSNTAGGATIDDHSSSQRTDKSVNLGTQVLPERTFGLSIGVPGSAAFQIGVPNSACMTARGHALEVQAESQRDIARARAEADMKTAQYNAQASLAQNDRSIRAQAVDSMTRQACDFAVSRAGTARESWEQFGSVSNKMGRSPTARAASQQLWGEAITASAQSMEAGSMCLESMRSQLGVQKTVLEVPPLVFDVPKPAPKPVPVQKQPEKTMPREEPCPDVTKRKP